MRRISANLIVLTLTFLIGFSAVKLISLARRSLINRRPAPIMTAGAIQETKQTSVTPSSNEPKLETLSPYGIQRFINSNPQASLEEVWHGLGIKSANFSESPHEDINDFFNKCYGCDAEIYEYDLDGQPGIELLMRVSDNLQEACRYLIFRRGKGNEWKLMGHIDHGFGRYRMPQHFFSLSGGDPYLIIQGQGASGSGVALYYDRLFKVTSAGVEEVLSYTSGGHQSGYGFVPDRDFSGRVLSCEIGKGAAKVEVEFAVSYSNYDDSGGNEMLWSKKQKAVYIRPFNSKRFILDPLKSGLSEKEIEAVYNIDSLTPEDLLKYNFEELRKIALGDQRESKEWLRQFLQNCEDVPHKKDLRQAVRR
jgi:hypothetical protein